MDNMDIRQCCKISIKEAKKLLIDDIIDIIACEILDYDHYTSDDDKL